MEQVAVAAGAWATVALAWFDMRKRTNGSGPLAGKLDELSTAVHRVESKLDDHLQDHT